MSDDIVTRITFDTERAKASLGDLEIEFGQTISKIASGWRIAKAAFEAVVGAVRSVVEWTGRATAAASEAEDAEAKYAATLKVRGTFTREALEGTKAYAAAVQSLTRLEDESIVNIRAKLLGLQVQNSRLQEATRATIGLAQVTGSLDSAASTVARTLAGKTTTLERMGFAVKDVDDAMQQLGDLFLLAEERGKTFQGRVDRLNNALGELEETGGGIITQNEAVLELLDRWREIAEISNAKLQENTKSAEGFTSAAADTASGLTDWLTISAKVHSEGLKPLSTTLGTMANSDLPKMDDRVRGLAAAFRAIADEVTRLAKEIRQLELDKIESARVAALTLAATNVTPDRPTSIDLVDAPKKGEILKRFGVGEKGRRTTEGKPVNIDRDLSVEAQAILFEGEADVEIEEQRLDRARAAAERRLDLQDQFRVIELDREAAHRERVVTAQLQHEQRQRESTNAFYSDMAGVGGAGIAAFTGAIVGGLARGNLSIGGVLGSFLGAILGGVGQSMMALGSAALAAATATSGIPLLWPIFGGPIGVAGATALIVAGSTLAAAGGAIGQAIGGGGGGGARGGGPRSEANPLAGSGASEEIQRRAARNAGIQRRREEREADRARGAPAGFSSRSEGPSVTHMHLHFGGQPLHTENEIGARVEQVLDRRAELRGQRGWSNGWRSAA